MCVLLLIGLMILMVAFSPLLALIFGIGVAVNGVQKKQNSDKPPLQSEFNQPLALRIAFILILLLGVFIAALVVRYWTT